MNHPSSVPVAHARIQGGGLIRPNNKSSKNNETIKTLAHALIPDLPLLMHGSGDVLPEHVNPNSVAVLAQLTERYIASLVSAAMDSHDIFTDGEVVGGGACLGIPPFASSSSSSSAAITAAAAADSGSEDDTNNYNAKEESEDATRKRRRSEKDKISKKFKQRKIDYWDQPLPAAATTAGGGGGEEDSSNNDLDSSINNSESSDEDSSDDLSSLRSGERRKSGFIGTIPIDLYANQRTREYYVSAPTAMDARSFIFPICHDAELYQRIKEMQANRRAISRDMMDHVLLQAVQEEGVNIGRMDVSDMWNSVLTSAVAAAAEEEVNNKGGSSNASNDGGNKAKEGGEDKKNVEADIPKDVMLCGTHDCMMISYLHGEV